MSQLDYIGTAETARRLGWSKAKVKREAQAGRLPVAMKLDGDTGAYLFHSAVIDHIASQETTAA